MNLNGLIGLGLGLALGVWPGWWLAWHQAKAQISGHQDAQWWAVKTRLETGLELDRVGQLSRRRLARLTAIRSRAGELVRLLGRWEGRGELPGASRMGELARQIEALAAELPESTGGAR